MDWRREHAINACASSAAAALAEFATLPVCTVKTVYQTGAYPNTRSAMRSIWRASGWRGFYRASLPAITAQALATSCKYTLYQTFQSRALQDSRGPLTADLFAAKVATSVASGLCCSLVTHPIDVCRGIYQRNETLRAHYRTSVFALAYRGYTNTIAKVALGSALFFPLYDLCLPLVGPGPGSPASASFISAVISTTLLHPVDYRKTRAICGVQPLYEGSAFRGLSLNLVRVVPHFMIVMTLTEHFKKRYARLFVL